jgi:serine/threonine-protein kinase
LLPLGTIISDRYRLDRILGTGGMGVVYAATQLGLDRLVAVKVVRGELMNKPQAAARLVREARSLATLRSPHVAQVIDVGTHEGAPFFVMELLRGKTVHELVSKGGQVPVQQAADITIQACHALGEAHRHGIVHRDVKPSNLFLSEDDAGATVLKVIDFGVSKARLFDPTETSAETESGALLGSPSFMSPEHVRSSSDVDGRTDIWSLGVILYYMLAAKKPFEAESLLELMTLIVHEPAPSLMRARPDLPNAIEGIVRQCFEKSRQARFRTAAELARALAPFASQPYQELALGMPLDPPPPPAPESAREFGEGKGSSDTEMTGSIEGTMPTGTLEPVPAMAVSSPRRTHAKSRSGLGVAVVLVGVMIGVGVGSLFWVKARPVARPTSSPPTPSEPSTLPAEDSPTASVEASNPPPQSSSNAPAAHARARPRFRAPPKVHDPTPRPKDVPTGPPELPRTPD